MAAPAITEGFPAAWHCLQAAAKGIPWAGLSLALPAGSESALKSPPCPPSQPGWWPLRLLGDSVSRLRNCHDFIPLNTEMVQSPALASHFWAQIFAVIRLSYPASTIKPIPAHPTQPPPQILQAPQSYLKGEKKGPVR